MSVARCLALLLAFVALPAAAQVNPFGPTAREFATADRERMYRSMIVVLESGEVGRIADWTSDDGTFGGTSELVRSFERDGMRCGEVRHVFAGSSSGRSRFDVPACDVPGEGWKFAF